MNTTTALPAKARRFGVGPEAERPCRSCGVIVRRPDPSRQETVTLHGQMTETLRVLGGSPQVTEIEVTRCDDCAKRRARAATLLAENPNVAGAHGQVALDRLDAGLAALDVAGIRSRRLLDVVTDSDDALNDLMGDVASIGGAASWSAVAGRVSPTGKRWGHVPLALAKAAGEAYRGVVHNLGDLPMPYAPPGSLDGNALAACLFCGVGSLTVKKRDARAAWGDARQVRFSQLGGRGRSEPAVGHLCPDCSAAVERVGAPGTPAVEHALLRFVGYTARVGGRLNYPTRVAPRAWVVAGVDRPNLAPWAHLDLSALRRALATAEDKRLVRKLTDRERRP